MAGSMELPAKGGFSFDLCPRNAMLEKNGLKMPGFRKTGTTIVGLVFQVRSCSVLLLLLLVFCAC
jgi:20S proteasome subunit beta 2